MAQYTRDRGEALALAYDFSGISHLVDVGGGRGEILAAIMKRSPRMRATLCDLQWVMEDARAILAREGLGDRVELHTCDFFRQVPGEGDAYMLSNVLHDWGDEECRTILANCYAAMPPGARLLVNDSLPPEGEPALDVSLLDLQMLVITGGRERTLQQCRQLLADAGFELTQVVPVTLPTATPWALLEAVRANGTSHESGVISNHKLGGPYRYPDSRSRRRSFRH